MKIKYLLLLSLALFILSVFLSIPDNNLHIVFCNVGQGDGILVKYRYKQLVIDGGPDNSILECIGKHLPFWDRNIETILITHADRDHYFGFISLIKRYKVNNVLSSFVDSDEEEFNQLKKEIAKAKIKVHEARKGVQLNEEYNFSIIYPSENILETQTVSKSDKKEIGSRQAQERNDYCAVSEIKYKKFVGIFGCDITPQKEEEILVSSEVDKAYLLHVPHHGSLNGLTLDFLKAVSPKLAVISVGEKNRYGHPSKEVLIMLEDFGSKVLRTDKNGEVELITDGERVWTKSQ